MALLPTLLAILLSITAAAANAANLVIATSVTCKLPPNAVSTPNAVWVAKGSRGTPVVQGCAQCSDNRGMWIMLNAYRAGGKEGVHWKHVQNGDFSGCLVNWTYYHTDGSTVIANITGPTTGLGEKDNKPWCALAFFNYGVRGKTWDFCDCAGVDASSLPTPAPWSYR